jgi:coenzyme F420-reducing hydrogenase gamma subunit
MNKPTVAVYKFSSCDGCQLSLLNLEDELLDIVGAVELAYFLEARRQVLPGPYDIGLVEGSVTTQHEADRIKEIRSQIRTLVSIGTCATAGGIQALRNFAQASEYAFTVYTHPEYLHYLDTSTPISQHVKVDYELWGCPINKYQLLEVIVATLQKRKPQIQEHPVCLDCKRQGTTCVMVSQGMLCMGPVTRSGCGAICPANGRGCYGCFGPAPSVGFEALANTFKKVENYPGEGLRLFRNISGYAPQFQQAAKILEETKP